LTSQREERLERPDTFPLPACKDEARYGGHVRWSNAAGREGVLNSEVS
jgi:hypothetical protein